MYGFHPQGLADVCGERQHGRRSQLPQKFANVRQARFSTLSLGWQQQQQKELFRVRYGLLGE